MYLFITLRTKVDITEYLYLRCFLTFLISNKDRTLVIHCYYLITTFSTFFLYFLKIKRTQYGWLRSKLFKSFKKELPCLTDF